MSTAIPPTKNINSLSKCILFFWESMNMYL